MHEIVIFSRKYSKYETCSAGVWKLQKYKLAQGQENCHKVLVHRKFYLAHMKEQIMYKDLSGARIVLKQYTCILYKLF